MIDLAQYRSALNASVVLFSALRYTQYRRFWLGNLASVTGLQMMWVAQGWLIFQLTGSALHLGYVGLAGAAPGIALNLLGGVYADRLDQRRLIIGIQVAAAALVAILAALTAADLVRVWHVLAVSFGIGSLQAFSDPARQAIFPHLLDRRDLMKAVALNSMIWQGTRIVAPATAGLLIATLGTGATLYVCSLSFLAMGLAAWSLQVPPVPRAQGRTLFGHMGEGLAFIRDNPLFAYLIGMTFFNSFFGMAAMQLMPVFAVSVLDIGASGLGLLYSVGGVGSMLGLFLTGALTQYRTKGHLLIGGAILFGAFLVLFALSTWLPLSLVALFFMGMFNSVYMITVQTTFQALVPDQLRGRVMGIYGMTWSLGPVGALQAGAMATALGAPIAVAIGGLAVVAFALIVASSNTQVRRLAPQAAS